MHLLFLSYTVSVVPGLKPRTLPMLGMSFATDPFLTASLTFEKSGAGYIKTSPNIPRARLAERLARGSTAGLPRHTG